MGGNGDEEAHYGLDERRNCCRTAEDVKTYTPEVVKMLKICMYQGIWLYLQVGMLVHVDCIFLIFK